MACTDDASFHLFRAVALGGLLEQGHLFPRWSAQMAQGYGFPFFNFYAPLSSYAVVLLHWAGLAYPIAIRAAFALILWAAGGAAFLFVRSLWGTRAGLAAAAAYVLAPYLSYDVHFRGNLAEAAAFVWPPLVLWALKLLGDASRDTDKAGEPAWRAVLRHPASFFAASAGLYACLILTHNISALMVSPLFAAYGLLLAWQARAARRLAWCALALLAGVALATYFWLPALAERGLVHSDRLLVPPIFTWYTNFITPGELLAAPGAEDPLLVNPSPIRAIGVVPALLCLPAVAAALVRGRRRPAHAAQIIFFGAALAVYGLLALDASAPLWRLIAPMEIVQFPWRFLAPAAVCTAVLVGASAHVAESWLGAGKAAGWGASLKLAAPGLAAIGLIFFGNLSWLYPRYCPWPAQARIADMVAYEQATATIGTTAKGEYLPRTAGFVPAEADLAQALLRGEEPSRLQLPEGAGQVTSAAPPDPLDASFQVVINQPVSAVYRQFYYPGWRASLNGQPLAIRPAPGDGLITFDLPPGSHTLRISFGSTPLRTAANAISLAALATLAGGWALMVRGRRQAAPGSAQARVGPAGEPGQLAAFPLLLLLLVLLKLLVIDRLPNPLRRTRLDAEAGTIAGLQAPLLADFAGGVRLHGYDLSATVLPASEPIDVALYASLRQQVDRRYWPALSIEDDAGLAWSVRDPLPPRWHREPPHTLLWPLDGYAQWARHLELVPGTPPGRYQLWGAVFDLDSLQLASMLDPAGNAIAPRFALETIDVTRPDEPFQLEPPRATPHDFGPLKLLGYDLNLAAANAGETVLLTMFWQALQPNAADYAVRLEWLAADGSAAHSLETEPVNGYPTSQWQAGDQWRGQQRLRLPADLQDGKYTLSVSVPGAGPGAQALGSVRVSAPVRSFEPPPVETPNGARLGEAAVLEGYNLLSEPGSLAIELVWRAVGSPEASLSVFVHLEGEAGRVWAQSDGLPANWSRPTTGWVAGEYIRDAHRLALPSDLPPGQYSLWAGLYDPLTGQRLAAEGAGAGPDGRVLLGRLALP